MSIGNVAIGTVPVPDNPDYFMIELYWINKKGKRLGCKMYPSQILEVVDMIEEEKKRGLIPLSESDIIGPNNK